MNPLIQFLSVIPPGNRSVVPWWDRNKVIKMSRNFLRISTPWMSVGTMALAYGFLGWRLSRYGMIWVIDSWIVACGVILALIFYGHHLGALTRMGPRSLATIFVLSMVITIAATYAEFFIIALVLVLSSVLARLELRSLGLSRGLTVVLLLILSGSFMAGGWFLGRQPIIKRRLPGLTRQQTHIAPHSPMRLGEFPASSRVTD
jgi:hypothetical protein